jgi:ABC-type Mn2+/Zn2+ transport system permease subunit
LVVERNMNIFYSLITALIVGFASGYIGSLMVLKKMALVGDALSHVALPGLALGIILHFEPYFGAFIFLFVSAILTWKLERSTRLSFEAIVGTLFTLSLAIGILLIPEIDLLEALFGDITKINLTDTVLAILVSVSTVIVTRSIYKKVVISMMSEELATSTGINVSRINLTYILLVSLIVAIGIKIVGTLLVGAMVIVPAATAKNIATNLTWYSWMSAFFGLTSTFLGVIFSFYSVLPAGPLVVITGTFIFVFTVLLRGRFLR